MRNALVRTSAPVLLFAVLSLAAFTVARIGGPPTSTAPTTSEEVCIAQSVTTNEQGEPIAREFPLHPDAKLKSGYYSAVYSVGGFVIGGVAQPDPTNPNLLCLLKVTINNGITSIECSRPSGRGCSTTCTLEQIPGQNGTTKHSCECSNRP